MNWKSTQMDCFKMNSMLEPLLAQGEQNLCPVYGVFKQTGFWASNSVMYPAYITCTNFNRLLACRYYLTANDWSRESYILPSAQKLRVKKTLFGQYICEAEFIVNGKKERLKFQIAPKMVGNKFPDQQINTQMLISLLETFEK